MASTNLRTNKPSDKPSRDAWLCAIKDAGFELKRTGANSWAGPCPLCGGVDRFHLKDDPPVVGCRGCMDGPGGRKRYGELCRLLFPREGRQSPPNRRPPPPTPPLTPGHLRSRTRRGLRPPNLDHSRL